MLVNIMIEELPHDKFEHVCNHLTIASPKDIQFLLEINEIAYIIKEGVMKI
jgi:hypothetical protein